MSHVRGRLWKPFLVAMGLTGIAIAREPSLAWIFGVVGLLSLAVGLLLAKSARVRTTDGRYNALLATTGDTPSSVLRQAFSGFRENILWRALDRSSVLGYLEFDGSAVRWHACKFDRLFGMKDLAIGYDDVRSVEIPPHTTDPRPVTLRLANGEAATFYVSTVEGMAELIGRRGLPLVE